MVWFAFTSVYRSTVVRIIIHHKKIQAMEAHKIELTIPTKWDDLTDWQLLKIARMLNKRGPAFDFMTWMYLNRVRWWQLKKAYNLRIVLNNVPLSELRTHFNWIYTQTDRTKFPKHQTLVPPMDRLVSLSIEEFSIADDLNNLYIKTKEHAYLRLLCAVLYREKNEAYDHLALEQVYSKRFKNASRDFLFAVHITFNGCKKSLVEKYKNVYPQIKVKQRSNKKSGMLDVVLKMSGQKFGTYQETKSTLVHTFLNELDESIKEQKEMETKYGKKS